jgi:hypothetical protein
MYFIRFNDIAVYAQESGKLVRTGIRYEIIDLDEETTFDSMCEKYPYANCKRLDYFKSESKHHIVPGYVLNFIKGIEAVQRRLIENDRDKIIDELLNDKK